MGGAEGKIAKKEPTGGRMPKKPTIEDARLILELYNLRREPELRKARQWWLTTFWPKNADDFVKVASAMGSEENNWLRQVGGYWGIAVSFVLNGVVSEKLFFQLSFCGELYFIFAKVRPLLKEIRERMNNPELFLNMEKAILGSKLGRVRFALACVAAGAALLPVRTMAKEGNACTPGTALHQSAPTATQGGLLLI